MTELSIPPAFLRDLILRMRAIMAREDTVAPNSGSNASDDEGPATLQEAPGDLQIEEVTEEIDAMDADHQSELVALMWVGRGDFDADDWQEALDLAAERRDRPVSEYLLSHPLVADHMANALDELGHGSSVLEDGEY